MVCTETYHLEMLLQESVSSTLNLANKLLIIRPQKKKELTVILPMLTSNIEGMAVASIQYITPS